MDPNFNKYENHTNSYMALRNAVGWIGILLPFVLMLGVLLIFKGDIIHDSISHYYHTGMRNVFVGAMCAVALFMFFYTGYDGKDNWIGNIAGFFAVGVALFPTTEHSPSDWIGIVPFISATAFFLSLAAFSLFQFTQTEKGIAPTQQKLARNKIYKICGIIMLACMISIVIYLNVVDDNEPKSSFVFWAETIALLAFGVSWLTKGETFYPDR